MLIYVYMKILDMTKMASVVIVAVLLLRLLLKRLPKAITYAMWAVVLFRLLCPFEVEVPVSVMPEITPVEETYTLAEVPIAPSATAMAAYRAVGDALNGGLGAQYIRTKLLPEEGAIVPTVTSTWWEVWILFGQYVWLVGILTMMGYAVVSYVRLRRKLVTATPLQVEVGEVHNIYIADEITTPFVMGLLRPKIYLPSALGEQERPYILAHERHHIRRGDHVIKLLAFIALCLHWFNPLVWVAFVLAGKDMEMSCDEAVIKKMGEDVRADYAATLLSLATGRRSIVSMPLAFGEGDPKGRIRNLAKWKKPAIWVSVVVAIVCAVLAVVLLTNPTPEKEAIRMENGREFVDLVPGTTYEIKQRLNGSLFSSFYIGEGGIDTFEYYVGKDYLQRTWRSLISNNDKEDGDVYIEVEEWKWQEFPFTKEEWGKLCSFSAPQVKNISETYEEILYQPIDERSFFLNVDGELWIVYIWEWKDGPSLDWIFSLTPKE